MSGHSHYSTIKRKKEASDAARGKGFSKLSRAISIAIRAGGGSNPEMNHQLRVAIEAARAFNMPKANIQRALSKVDRGGSLEEITYEGFGPGGIAIIVEVATDNRNRAGQEIKSIFEHGGGQLAGPGAVSYNFEPKGLIVVKKTKNTEAQMLKMIDLEIEDIEETDDGIEVYVEQDKLSQTRKKLEGDGFSVTTAELTQKPKNFQSISTAKRAKKALSLLEKLEINDDVQKVFSNLDIPDEIVSEI